MVIISQNKVFLQELSLFFNNIIQLRSSSVNYIVYHKKTYNTQNIFLKMLYIIDTYATKYYNNKQDNRYFFSL